MNVIKKIINTIFKDGQNWEEIKEKNYLNQATGIVDLEIRMRNIEYEKSKIRNTGF